MENARKRLQRLLQASDWENSKVDYWGIDSISTHLIATVIEEIEENEEITIDEFTQRLKDEVDSRFIYRQDLQQAAYFNDYILKESFNIDINTQMTDIEIKEIIFNFATQEKGLPVLTYLRNRKSVKFTSDVVNKFIDDLNKRMYEV